MKVTDEKGRIRIRNTLVRDTDPRIRIRTKMSRIRNKKHFIIRFLFDRSYPVEGRAWAEEPGPTWVTVRPVVAAAGSWLGSWWGQGSRGWRAVWAAPPLPRSPRPGRLRKIWPPAELAYGGQPSSGTGFPSLRGGGGGAYIRTSAAAACGHKVGVIGLSGGYRKVRGELQIYAGSPH